MGGLPNHKHDTRFSHVQVHKSFESGKTFVISDCKYKVRGDRGREAIFDQRNCPVSSI